MDKFIRPFKTKGGTHVPHKKNTSGNETVFMNIPETVIIPMAQHIGAPCKPIVKKGDTVLVGQVIGDSEAFVSAPVHASVSGTVTDVIKFTLTSGMSSDAVCIKSDGEMTLHPDIKKPEMISGLKDFAAMIRQSGLVGLGGAGFPAHVKLNVPDGKKVDYLLINAAECEPYLTCDHREALENGQNVIDGIKLVKKICNIPNAIIGIEDNKPDAIEYLSNLAEKSGDTAIKVMSLKASYPQGAEKVLIKAATNREVPAGKLPIDMGCVVMNIGSVSFVHSYMKNGIPLIKKRITVDGSAIKKPMNVIVPIGTKIKDLVEFTGGYKVEAEKILMGGPMMGVAVVSDEVPILKQNNGILCFDKNEATLLEPSDCIRCGRCVKACPMKLYPTLLEKYSEKANTEELTNLNILTCMECGCCSYSCPAGRRLVQAIRLGKSHVRKAGSK